MKLKLSLSLAGLGSLLLAAPGTAQTVHVETEIPRINVAEYHKPYVAIWISNADRSVIRNLGAWYQLTDGAEGHGETWLKDMRQWWRRIGRSLDMPVDGVSSPTKAPGKHSLEFTEADPHLKDLPAGEYTLYVEAAREVGGREMLRIPFSWGDQAPFSETVTGETELGSVTLTIKP